MINNLQLAALLRRVAVVFTLTGEDFFRARAYENAAGSIETLEIPVSTLWEQGRLGEIPFVGSNLISHLDELFRTGHVRRFESKLKQVPQGLFPLLTIRGIGPKTALKIAIHFKLTKEGTALAKFSKIVDSGRLTEVEGIKQALADKITTSLKSHFSQSGRLDLEQSLVIADDFTKYLLSSPVITKAEPLGSLRRRVDTVGDIDLAISTNEPAMATRHVLAYPQIATVISSGEYVSRVKLVSDHEVDIKLSKSKEWGSLLQHYTGSKLHNILLRNLALDRGLSISEHGIKDPDGRLHTFRSEESLYKYLALDFIAPELREGRDEIKCATNHTLPSLLEIGDIRGDLHLHSDFSFKTSHDLGGSPLSDLLDYGRANRYSYLGLSDHNPILSGLTTSERRKIIQARKDYLFTQYYAYEKRVKSRVPKLLIGLEIDIRQNGDLSFEPELIDLLDYAIVSIHSGFDYNASTNTSRIMRALSAHPKIILLGHPTGRLINRRPPINADWSTIFDFAGKNHKYLEINASPHRLDLSDDLIREASRYGVKFIINTDSHDVSQMSNMRYGVWTARRGWLSKSSIVNTVPFSDLHQMLQ